MEIKKKDRVLVDINMQKTRSGFLGFGAHTIAIAGPFQGEVLEVKGKYVRVLIRGDLGESNYDGWEHENKIVQVL